MTFQRLPNFLKSNIKKISYRAFDLKNSCNYKINVFESDVSKQKSSREKMI